MTTAIIILSSVLFVAIVVLLSLRYPWWRKNRQGLRVLCYHKVGTPPQPCLKDLWVSPEKFRKQVRYLKTHGWKTLTFAELYEIYKKKDPIPEKSVLITFDDGYQNNYTVAYPILKELDAKGNIFLVFNTIGKVNSWHNPSSEPWVNMCTMEQIREMQESGVIDFGGHTLNHPHLGKLDHEAARTEIIQSKKMTEQALGRELVAFAYPYGDGAYNERVRKIAIEDAGYTFDFSFKEGITAWPWERENHTIDRLYIKGSDDMTDFVLHLKKGNTRII